MALAILIVLGGATVLVPILRNRQTLADGQRSAFPTPEQLGGNPEAVIVLVHGTFAPRADWTAPEAPLVQAIKSHFKGLRVMFQPFDWPGFFGGRFNNTHLHRYGAARTLVQLLKSLHQSFPEACVFVVAHSHGGNVALYAAGDQSSDGLIHGVVSLGTPFIKVAPRELQDDLPITASIFGLISAGWYFFLLFCGLLGVAGLLFGVSWLFGDHGWLGRIFGAIIALISIGIGSWYLERDGTEQVWVPDPPAYPSSAYQSSPYSYHPSGSRGRYETRTKYKVSKQAEDLRSSLLESAQQSIRSYSLRKQTEMAERLTARVSAHVPLLCIHTATPDEAKRALDLTAAILGLPGRLLGSTSFTAGVSACVLAAAVLLGMGAGIWMLGGIFRENWGKADFSFGDMIGTVLGSAVIGGTVAWLAGTVALLALFVLAPLSVVLRAPLLFPALLAYGSSDLVAEYVATTTVASEPVGFESAQPGTTVKTFELAGSSPELRHSRYYSDPEPIQEVSLWLRERYKEACEKRSR